MGVIFKWFYNIMFQGDGRHLGEGRGVFIYFLGVFIHLFDVFTLYGFIVIVGLFVTMLRLCLVG